MKIIKFRIYDDITPTPRMIYQNDLFSMTLDGKLRYGNADFTKDYKIMQYTGLKDKNGVEIYEGDIIEFKPYTVSCDSKRRGIVVYDKANYCAEIKNQFKYNIIDCFDLEVIGNVFENKELLNE
mgnify:CR=1 FL=1